MRTMCAVAVVVATVSFGIARAGIIPVADVPKGAKEAADQAAPGVEWLVASKDAAGGYMLLGKDAQKRTVEFLTDAPGKKCAVRVDIVMGDVPAEVSAALRKEMPNFVPKSVQACGKETKTVTVYRFQGEGYQGGNAGVYVTADGKKVVPLKE